MNFQSTTKDQWPTSVVGASQIELEQLYAKNQLIPVMREDLEQDFGEAAAALAEDRAFAGVLCPARFVIDLMVQASLHRRTTIETMVGILVHHFEAEPYPYQACADAIVSVAEADFVDMKVRQDPLTGRNIFDVIVKYDIRPETKERTDRFQYPLPMIEQPKEVCNNRDTGYNTIRNSLILKKNHHDEDICLDHINRVNSQCLSINADVLAFVQNSWKNLDRQKPDETYAEFQKRKKAFQKYDSTSRDVLQAMLTQEDGFWLTHKYDKRGRTYSQGYHANYQGNDWNKACIQFAHKEVLK